MPTVDNLNQAFAGESQANRRYVAFAKQAQADGLPQIAKLFRAAAEAETVHALAHLKVLGWPKKTVENLQAAMNGESYEFTTMYPQFIEQAVKEGQKQAQNSFSFANEVEKIHHVLYSKAMEAAKAGKDLDAQAIHVCPICGNTVLGQAPDRCPICGTPKDKFVEIK